MEETSFSEMTYVRWYMTDFILKRFYLKEKIHCCNLKLIDMTSYILNYTL